LEHLIKSLKQMNDRDWKILKIIEIGMKNHEWVPLDIIKRMSKMSEGDILHTLKKLDKFKFINRSIYGYRLSHSGYDALALNTFIKRDILKGIGNKLGVGKEGDVYTVLLSNNREGVLKLHKLGRTCFTRGKRYRDYLANKRHISWLYASRLTAEREYKILNELFPLVKVPQPIDQNRHGIIMGKIDGGVELKRVDLEKMDVDIKKLFWNIIEEIKKMYNLGYIHGDLSEFNILIKEDGDFVIIDFPQAIDLNEERVLKFDKIPGEYEINKEYYLKRDIGNIIRYFKKYGISEDVDKIYNYITNTDKN